MTTRIGAILSNFDVIGHIEPLPRERHTYCVTEQVDNPSLRAAMSLFDDSLVAGPRPSARIVTGRWGVGKSTLSCAVVSVVAPVLLGAGTHLAPAVLYTGLAARGVGSLAGSFAGAAVGSFVVVPASSFAGKLRESTRSLEPVLGTSAHKVDDVVEVVRDLQRRLGIDLKDVLAAVGIKPRTYHSWAQPSSPRPRLASQGQLWALAQLVDDLPELLNVPLRQWILAEPDRLAALRTGRFDELLEQATHERIQKDPVGTVAGPFHGVGGDSPLSPPTTNRLLVVDEQAITEPPPPSRGSLGLPPT